MYRLIKKYKIYLVYLPLVLYWVILFLLTSIPVDDFFHDKFELSDKWKHFIAYMILAFLLSLALKVQERIKLTTRQIITRTIIIGASYGILDELHQLFIPGRYCEFLDYAADLAGILTGTILAFYFIIRKMSPVGEEKSNKAV